MNSLNPLTEGPLLPTFLSGFRVQEPRQRAFLKGQTTSEETINSVCIWLLLIALWMKLEQETSEWGPSSTHAPSGKSVLPVNQLPTELLNPPLSREGPGSDIHCPQSRPEVSQDVKGRASDFRERLNQSYFVSPLTTPSGEKVPTARALK